MTPPATGAPVVSMALRHEHDVVAARQRGRQVAALLGFDTQDQTRIATAVSEIARNAFRYAGGGRVTFVVEGRTAPQVLAIRIADEGPGIAELDRVLDGTYRSSTGLGLGIAGTRRLMDQFRVESAPGRGTTVWLRKVLPDQAPLVTPSRLAAVAAALIEQRPRSPLEEVQQQNQELLRALDELRARQEELARLNGELEDTNRGVVALLAELDEKADHLRRADEMKTRFLSNMTHEFRTPLNAVLALSRLLLDRGDGDLTAEQERQVGYIRKAAEDLSEIVDDLLDLARVEAGKTVVRPVQFEVGGLFGALRGMLRPLLVNESVALVFDEVEGVPPLYTDERKVSQILRNFISNALKFTERGEVRVSAALAAGAAEVVFSVADTGIGIAPQDQERIFQEFGQLDSPVQRRVRGTGLGLPLTRKLTELLGGRLALVSQPGVGSTFSAILPRRFAEAYAAKPISRDWLLAAQHAMTAPRLSVLVIDDDETARDLIRSRLPESRFAVVEAADGPQGLRLAQAERPDAIVLDLVMPGLNGAAVLAALKSHRATRHIPVVVVTSKVLDDDDHRRLAPAAAVLAKSRSLDEIPAVLLHATASAAGARHA